MMLTFFKKFFILLFILLASSDNRDNQHFVIPGLPTKKVGT